MDTKSMLLMAALFAFIVLSTSAAYFRFMVIHDYTVAYEGDCDPYTHVCFIACEDDECTSEYYYSKVQKYAPILNEQCGLDITDCESASVCLEGEVGCSITYCNPEADGDECGLLAESEITEPDDADATPEDATTPMESDEIDELIESEI